MLQLRKGSDLPKSVRQRKTEALAKLLRRIGQENESNYNHNRCAVVAFVMTSKHYAGGLITQGL